MDVELLVCDFLFSKKQSLDNFKKQLRRQALSSEQRCRAQALLDKIIRSEIRLTWFGRADYPESFLHLSHPPAILTYWGSPVWLKSPMLSVVGSREPSEESLHWMDGCLAEVVLEYGLTIVSGGARGIDQKAHRLALRLEKPTVAFLPSGLLSPYPKELGGWIESIVAGGGAVVSEFHPEAVMYKSNFYQRNRLIAALSRALLVVEARQTGGTMMTAEWAAQQGVDVCCPPGHPTDPRFAGNLKLLSQGVDWVIGPSDFDIYFHHFRE